MKDVDWIKTRMELDDVSSELGLYENKVLLHIANRLKLGQSQYGPLDEIKIDNKDWLKEASDELFDNAVYLTLQVMKIRRTENG